MDWSYDYASKGSNKKVKDEYDDSDEKGKPTEDVYGGYPYEDGAMSKPAAVVVDGGQRKSSITHYPNMDGSDSYVVRTERVVKVVRPAMSTHYSLMAEDHDNLGMAKDFLDQFMKEAGMSAAPVQSRTYWGSKQAWADRDDSPLKYAEHCQFSPPNMGTVTTVAKFPSWEDTEHQELGLGNTGSKHNWSSRDDSPPRSVAHPQWNHPNHSGGRHNWPIQNESPPRSMTHPELNHINSSGRPNWPSDRDDSSPRPLIIRHQLSQLNAGPTPNWPRQYDSPPRSMEYHEQGHPNSRATPNWPSPYNSPRSTRQFVSNHPNSSTRIDWSTHDDSPPRSMTHPESSYYPNSNTRSNWPSQYDSPPKSRNLGSSHPNSGVRPNWSSRYDSPHRPTEYPLSSNHNSSAEPKWPSRVESSPKSMTYPALSHPDSVSTKLSWSSEEDYPDNIENGRDKINTGLVLKKFDELNLQDSRGTSPLPNESSGSDVAKTANYNGTNMDSGQRPNWPNRKGHVDYVSNSGISPYKSNKDDQEKPKFNGAQSKNTNDEEIPDNHKIVTQRPYSTDWQVEDEDDDDGSKKSGMLGSSTNVGNKVGKTKPNYSSGWYKQPNPPPVSHSTTNDEGNELMKLVEEAKKTATYNPNEITPNPPLQVHYSMYAAPAAPLGYYKPVLDSNEASMKYQGIHVPSTYLKRT